MPTTMRRISSACTYCLSCISSTNRSVVLCFISPSQVFVDNFRRAVTYLPHDFGPHLGTHSHRSTCFDVCWRLTSMKQVAWKFAASRLEIEMCTGMGLQIKKTKTLKDQFDLTYMRKMARNCGEASKNLLSRCLDSLFFPSFFSEMCRAPLLRHQLCVFDSKLILRGQFQSVHTISDCALLASQIMDEQQGWSARTCCNTPFASAPAACEMSFMQRRILPANIH